MSLESNTNQQVNTEPFEPKNNKKRNIIIGLAALSLIGVIAVPRILKKFEKKEAIVCLNNQTEIYEKYKDAVVLVKHSYTFQVSIKGSKPFEIEALNNNLQSQTICGTGFFVSEDGKIVTNHHVAEPWLYDENNAGSESYVKEIITAILPDSIAPQNYKTYLEAHWEEGYGRDIEEDYDEEENSDETTAAAVEAVNLDNDSTAVVTATGAPTIPEATPIAVIKMVTEDDIEITAKTVEISIALHGSNDNWLQCKVLKVSEDQEVDVAVLQLKSQSLPSSVSEIINLKTAITDDDTIKPGTNAILIGYPMGLTLASTRQGIKVQVYEGQINKESDGVSIQYNVTSTHGASGSPVFNQCGQLIAVNYAGYDVAQGYNFGIVAKHAQYLVE
jgi:S1-C subfamily serine protease